MAAPTLDLIALRKRIGLTQAEMAERMGLGSRAYFTLEQDPASINARHIMLAQMVSLREAVERQDRALADAAAAALADQFAELPPPAAGLASTAVGRPSELTAEDHSTGGVKMMPRSSSPYRAHLYDENLSPGDPVDVDASSFEEAARKAAGCDVTERGSRHQLAVKVWDRSGRSRLYYRR